MRCCYSESAAFVTTACRVPEQKCLPCETGEKGWRFITRHYDMISKYNLAHIMRAMTIRKPDESAKSHDQRNGTI